MGTKRIQGYLSKFSMVLILIVLCVAVGIARPVFFSTNNIYNLLRTTSIQGLVAIGMTFVIITGGIDLSVGSVVGFTSVVCAVLIQNLEWPVALAVICSLIAGTMVGLINGIVIYKGKVPPFIVTLGSMQAFSGIAMMISDGRTIPGLPDGITNFAQMKLLGIPSLFITWIVVTVLAAIALKRTRFGRNVYSIGSNVEATRLSGINVGVSTVFVYIVAALCAALAGLLLTSRITSGQPSAGTGYEMEAIAAAVIGGASLSGAEGSVIGTFVGALIMQVLINGGNLLGIKTFAMDVIIGVIVVVAVLIDKNKSRKG